MDHFYSSKGVFWVKWVSAIPFECTWGGWVERSPIKKIMGGGGQDKKIGGLHEKKIIVGGGGLK